MENQRMINDSCRDFREYTKVLCLKNDTASPPPAYLFSNVLAEAISASKFPFQSFVVVDLVRKLVYFPN